MSQPKRRVFTTMRPETVIEVTESEYTDLLRQGLVAREDIGDAPVPPAVTVGSAAKRKTKTAPSAHTSTKEN